MSSGLSRKEEQFIAALMYLGAAPNPPPIEKPATREASIAQREQYLSMQKYDAQLVEYYILHVFAPGRSSIDNWMKEFYEWQKQQKRKQRDRLLGY